MSECVPVQPSHNKRAQRRRGKPQQQQPQQQQPQQQQLQQQQPQQQRRVPPLQKESTRQQQSHRVEPRQDHEPLEQESNLDLDLGWRRARTPSQQRDRLLNSLGSPTAVDNAPEFPSPKAAMICPQPRRMYASPQGGLLLDNPPGSPWSTNNEEACNELRELLGGPSKEPGAAFNGILFDSGQAFENRPLSSVSTCLGPTPGPEDRVVTPANDRAGTPGWQCLDSMDVPELDGCDTPQPQEQLAHQAMVPVISEPEDHDDKSGLPTQVRKVFVGGIPQTMNQDDLYTIFGEFAGVKKAWLQRHRPGGNMYGVPQRNHRGFGFIIFHDGRAVDHILGNHNSRFIVLRDGRKLEVKRAVSSNDMATTTPPAVAGPRPKTQHDQISPASGWQGTQQGQIPPSSPWQHEQQWSRQAAPVQVQSLPAASSLPSLTWAVSSLPSLTSAVSSLPSLTPAPHNINTGMAALPSWGAPSTMPVGALVHSYAIGPGVIDANRSNNQQASILVPVRPQHGRIEGQTEDAAPAQQPQQQQLQLPWAPPTASSGDTVPQQKQQQQQQQQKQQPQRHQPLSQQQQQQQPQGRWPQQGEAAASSMPPLPRPYAMQPQQNSRSVEAYSNNKELESALLQAMPAYYED